MRGGWDGIAKRLDLASQRAGWVLEIDFDIVVPPMQVAILPPSGLISFRPSEPHFDLKLRQSRFGDGGWWAFPAEVSVQLPSEEEAMLWLERLAETYEDGGNLKTFRPPHWRSTLWVLVAFRIQGERWAGYEQVV